MTLFEVIVELFLKIDSREWDALRGDFCEDCIYERPGYAPIMGLERLQQFYREERVIAAGQHFLEKIVIDGAAGACWGSFSGTHKDSSRIHEKFADTYTFREGKIHTRKSYFFRPAV